MITIPIINNSNNELPKYETEQSAGMDLRADLTKLNSKFLFGANIIYNDDESIKCLQMAPGSRALIPTGLHIKLPKGYEAQVRCRSGLALKHGIMVTNGIGTIDADYTGDIGVILTNTSNSYFQIDPGDRIAQLVITKHEVVSWEEVETLEITERGEGGFNSTGVK